MCGIIAIYEQEDVIQDIYDGLTVLQHRGQDAAGISTYDGKQFHMKKGNGLVRDVFRTKNILRLKGNYGIGHVRYPTAGSNSSDESQPFYVNSPYGISLAHNGNLTNTGELAKHLFERDLRHLNTTSDSEILLNVLADELIKEKALELKSNQVFKAVERLMGRVKGSYAVISLLADQGILAFRDPFGIKPIIVGERSGKFKKEYIIASEDVAIKTLGFKVIRDIAPGEAVFVDKKGKIYWQVCAKKTQLSPCIFEHVYFARPDSFIDDVSVYKTRLRMGEKLAEQIKKANLKIDTVIPVPESSRPSAMQLANEIGVKYREGFVKNRYIGRTFIMPGQEIRKKSVRYKLSPVNLEFKNRNVLLVDDSIVRGNTSQQIVDMAREAGAKNVYFASAAPPLLFPCLYGVDMPSKKDFIANKLTQEEIRKLIGADALFYQTIEDLLDAAREGNPKIKKFCSACFDGDYVTGDITEEMLESAECSRGCKVLSEEDQQITLV